jgi:hypothetical protein
MASSTFMGKVFQYDAMNGFLAIMIANSAGRLEGVLGLHEYPCRRPPFCPTEGSFCMENACDVQAKSKTRRPDRIIGNSFVQLPILQGYSLDPGVEASNSLGLKFGSNMHLVLETSLSGIQATEGFTG